MSDEEINVEGEIGSASNSQAEEGEEEEQPVPAEEAKQQEELRKKRAREEDEMAEHIRIIKRLKKRHPNLKIDVTDVMGEELAQYDIDELKIIKENMELEVDASTPLSSIERTMISSNARLIEMYTGEPCEEEMLADDEFRADFRATTKAVLPAFILHPVFGYVARNAAYIWDGLAKSKKKARERAQLLASTEDAVREAAQSEREQGGHGPEQGAAGAV